MAIYTDGESGCACARTVCDYGCHTYAAKMNKQLKENLCISCIHSYVCKFNLMPKTGISSCSQYVKGKCNDSITFAGMVSIESESE